jgi:amidase
MIERCTMLTASTPKPNFFAGRLQHAQALRHDFLADAVAGNDAIGEVTPLDLLDALEKRIAEVDGKVNALPTLCFDRARATPHADEEAGRRARPARRHADPDQGPDRRRGRADHAGLADLQGQHPEEIRPLVEHLEAKGGSIYAKSNTPEFGAGANTFNEVFGATRNPWDTSRSAAGSSGGAAVALATGMAWLAHGSDMGGSLAQSGELLRHRRHAAEHRPRRAYAVGSKIDRNLGQSRARWRAMSRTWRCCSMP